ncbi:MAG TPA: hypothetical protein VEG30_14455 [Terriglobales bacterium]|nr:hypothetical protein [Terriglobales bacterium]
MTRYGKLLTALLAGWFTFALVGSALHLFTNAANQIGIAVALSASSPILIFFLWFATSENFRRYTLSLDSKSLTSLQSWRVVGVVFVLMEARGILPAIFALPAGYGDIFIGATASSVALWLAKPNYRNTFIVWQLLGITDLLTAVTLGTTARLLDPHGPLMTPMTVLPLSLIPTFLVPLFFILHVICIAQAKSWKKAVRPASLPQTQAIRMVG